MKIICGLEIMPYQYDKQSREFPNQSVQKEPEAWNDYWVQCLADSGLHHLKPIQLGSYWVDIELITNKNLTIVIQKELERRMENLDAEAIDDWEAFSACLRGGMLLMDRNKLLIYPTCCTDLQDLSNWEALFSIENADWNHLWIGHPWIFYKKVGDSIVFSDFTERNLRDFPAIKPVHTFSAAWLQTEIHKVMAIRDRLEQRVLKILIKLKLENPEKAAKILTGM